MQQLDTPVLFLIFNRPDTTTQVFERIKQVQPKQLFVAADGPRQNKGGEDLLCKQTREIVINNIDWPCEVKTLFRDENLGCGKAVSQAITWFFENVEMGIILEDDILPDESFFHFCQECLIKYKYNPNIFSIKGTHLHDKNTDDSYYFSKIGGIWGWAAWARSWAYYDFEPEYDKKKFDSFLNNAYLSDFYYHRLENYKQSTKTWDGQWYYTIISNNALTIEPNNNLINNIGFNDEASHTKNVDFKFKTKKMNFPLTHPTQIKDLPAFDLFHAQTVSKITNKPKSSFLQKIKNIFN